MENWDEKKVNDENNRMTEHTDIDESTEAVECYELDDTNENVDKKEGKKGGFWKGFVTGAAASMCGIILFCGGWLIGQQKSLKDAETNEEIGAAVLTDDATLRKLSQVQELIEDYYKGGTLLDVGTGSGILALCAAKPDCTTADCIEFARMYSAEIEYSEENINTLLDTLWEED